MREDWSSSRDNRIEVVFALNRSAQWGKQGSGSPDGAGSYPTTKRIGAAPSGDQAFPIASTYLRSDRLTGSGRLE